jgi:hypothetical protein
MEQLLQGWYATSISPSLAVNTSFHHDNIQKLFIVSSSVLG